MLFLMWLSCLAVSAPARKASLTEVTMEPIVARPRPLCVLGPQEGYSLCSNVEHPGCGPSSAVGNLTERKSPVFKEDPLTAPLGIIVYGFPSLVPSPMDCLCGLVVRVSGYRSRGSRFSEKQRVWNGVHSAS
jgi:hypothetical protein